jgi:hypothetical protein
MAVTKTKSFFQLPAVYALSIQCISFLLVLLSAYVIGQATGFDLTLVQAAIAQGLLACCLSRWRNMPMWWLFIQLFFPIAILFTLSLHLPPIAFLLSFLVFLALFWTTFRTQVPYYPSDAGAWNAVAGLLPEKPIKFIDIGSGFGGLVINLAHKRTESSFTGIEIAPLPWLISLLRVWIGRSRCTFLRGDYNQLNFADYDVIFAYLSPAAMPSLWEKAQKEMRAGSILLSYEFSISARAPDISVQTNNQSAELYGWLMK